ncbi:MAG: hypothetical protein WBD95_00140, partial [Xanthobacteraceae bacterium]
MGRLADLYPIRAGVRDRRSLAAQIVALCGRLLALSIFGHMLVSGISARAADRFVDITLRTGIQLKEQLGQLAKKYPDVEVGLRYFEDQKLYPEYAGLTELGFRVENKTGYYSLFFIPVSARAPTTNHPNNVHLELSAIGPKGGNVLLGTVSSEGKQLEVKDEKQVIAGKVEPSKDY